MGLMAETLGDKDFLGFALQHCAAQFGGAERDHIPPILACPRRRRSGGRTARMY